MDRQALMLDFARRLDEVVADGNWEALARIDGRLAAGLAEMTASGPLTAGERIAYEQLRGAHRSASERCARELRGLGEKLEQMRSSRDGWQAYAANGELEERQA